MSDCDCVFDADPDDADESTPETSWHYNRRCKNCGFTWFGLHCEHDRIQRACPNCELVPEPAAIMESGT